MQDVVAANVGCRIQSFSPGTQRRTYSLWRKHQRLAFFADSSIFDRLRDYSTLILSCLYLSLLIFVSHSSTVTISSRACQEIFSEIFFGRQAAMEAKYFANSGGFPIKREFFPII